MRMDDTIVAQVVAAMPCAQFTLSSYLIKWRSILVLLAPALGVLADVADVLLRPAVHYKALRTCTESTGTLRGYVVAIKALFKHGGNPLRLRLPGPPTEPDWVAAQEGWHQAFMFCEATLNAQAKLSMPNARQAAVHCDYDQVRALYHAAAAERAPHATLTSSQTLVLLSFYAHQVPKRVDLGAVHILKDAADLEALDATNNKANYILLKECLLVLRTYKTANVYGNALEALKPQFVADLHTSLQRHPRAFLFVGREGTPHRSLPINNNQFNKMVQTVFKRLTGKKHGRKRAPPRLRLRSQHPSLLRGTAARPREAHGTLSGTAAKVLLPF